jgi:hypothetical protein
VEVIDILENGHRTLIAAVKALPDDDWYIPKVRGPWSVKDILSHLASFELMLIDVLRSLRSCAVTGTVEAFTADRQVFNRRQVEARRDRTAREVWKEYLVAHTRAMAYLKEFSAADLKVKGALPWYGAEYDLEEFLINNFYTHKREHSAQIRRFSERLERERSEIE